MGCRRNFFSFFINHVDSCEMCNKMGPNTINCFEPLETPNILPIERDPFLIFLLERFLPNIYIIILFFFQELNNKCEYQNKC